MCAISGSSTLNKAFNLYEKGLERGHFGSGLLAIYADESVIIKQREPFTKESIMKQLFHKKEDALYYAFHSRAPTNSANTEWNYDATHPFNFDTYYVAHNGIINNFKTFPEHVEFEIDSSIIPYHLQLHQGDISTVYSKYTGLLTSWVYECTENKFNVVKAGSSLFRDKNSFSSVAFENSVCIERDGIIFELGTDSNLHEVSDFDYTNPYFIL